MRNKGWWFTTQEWVEFGSNQETFCLSSNDRPAILWHRDKVLFFLYLNGYVYLDTVLQFHHKILGVDEEYTCVICSFASRSKGTLSGSDLNHEI